ncbi:iron hydrogenase [Clostridium perfringens]|nr:iron hydrogenase [Clostridium perfringens]
MLRQEGNDRLLRSCAIKAKDGMVIKTDSEKVLEARKERVAELLDEHDFKCGPCKRRENCEFLKLVIKTKARAQQTICSCR